MVKSVKISILFSALLLVGCSARPPASSDIIVPEAQLRPGVVEYVWAEPIVDVLDVPPGLDPDGVYYRPAHKEVVEIRQGRYEYYKGSGN